MEHTQKKWMRLDNAAQIYPAAQNKRWAALFRLSAELYEKVDPQVLALAQANTLRRFPAYSVRLRKGVFWYYLEQLDGQPEVEEDVNNPCVPMNYKKSPFMFRVRYYENRIAVEFFHVLTDGTGGLSFLKTLVAEYIELKYGEEVERSGDILDCSQAPAEEELEDSFSKFARRVTKSRSEKAAYCLKGTKEPDSVLSVITGTVPANVLKEKARGMSATVTEFCGAILIQSIYRLQQREPSRRQRLMPVKISIPINLRKFYKTGTTRNFASYVNPGIEPKYGEYSFEEILKIIHHYMGIEATEKLINARVAANVSSARNPALRMAPLFIKNSAMKFAYMLQGDRYTSGIVSNLGQVKLPENMERHVKRLELLLGPLKRNPVTCAMIAYNGQVEINFTSTIMEREVERGFFTTLVKMGIPVKIESNAR